jgi:hypothetical protein
VTLASTRRLVALTAFAWLGCAHRQPSTAALAQSAELAYRIEWSKASRALDVEVRLVSGEVCSFLFTVPGGIEEVRAELGDKTLTTIPVGSQGELTLPAGWASVRYRYPIADLVRSRGADFSSGAGRGDSFVVAGRSYLLRPTVASPGISATVTVEGIAASLPWNPEREGHWRLRAQDLVDSGFHAFGGHRCSRKAADAQIEITRLEWEGPLAGNDEVLCDWIASSAREVLTVRGRFPYARTSVTLLPVDSTEASPFGMVLWSDPPSLAILVGARATADEFRRDWVATHELLHLTHPVFAPKEPWLSEGLATYFTELARARSGRYTAEKAWSELVAGFDRGRDQAGEMKMAEATSGIGGGYYLALYWSGALFCLDLDLQIRRATNGAKSLDAVLEQLATAGVMSSLEAFGTAVDALAGKAIFEATLKRHRSQVAFAESPRLLQALGVSRKGDTVAFTPAQDAPLRDALTSKRPSIPGE